MFINPQNLLIPTLFNILISHMSTHLLIKYVFKGAVNGAVWCSNSNCRAKAKTVIKVYKFLLFQVFGYISVNIHSS